MQRGAVADEIYFLLGTKHHHHQRRPFYCPGTACWYFDLTFFLKKNTHLIIAIFWSPFECNCLPPFMDLGSAVGYKPQSAGLSPSLSSCLTLPFCTPGCGLPLLFPFLSLPFSLPPSTSPCLFFFRVFVIVVTTELPQCPPPALITTTEVHIYSGFRFCSGVITIFFFF